MKITKSAEEFLPHAGFALMLLFFDKDPRDDILASIFPHFQLCGSYTDNSAPAPPPPTHSTAPAHWRTRRRSNEIARMGLPEITDHQLDLKLPTPLGTQVTACPPGALLWQNAKRCTRQCAACGCDIQNNQIQIFQRYSSHENVGPLLLDLYISVPGLPKA